MFFELKSLDLFDIIMIVLINVAIVFLVVVVKPHLDTVQRRFRRTSEKFRHRLKAFFGTEGGPVWLPTGQSLGVLTAIYVFLAFNSFLLLQNAYVGFILLGLAAISLLPRLLKRL